MKGLILNDFFTIRAYFMFLFTAELFIIIIGAVYDGIGFLLMYPCILAGMIAVSLISYEEKEKWDVYARTLPYKKSELVLGKYITSLIICALTALAVSLSQGISAAVRNSFDLGSIITLCFGLLSFSLIPSAILMPMIYKLGIEKGRLAYYLVIGLFCGLFASFGNDPKTLMAIYEIASNPFFPIIAVAASLAVYVGSYFLSVALYVRKKL